MTDNDLAERLPQAHNRQPVWATFVGGILMGSADVVPGVSGGTIALVFGIYERLVQEIRAGAGALSSIVRGQISEALERLRRIDWVFLISLGVGIVAAVASLARLLEHLLEDQPIALSGLFLGLVAGSVVVAMGMFKDHGPAHMAVVVGMAGVTFFALGAGGGTIEDPALPLYTAAGALAICAMILPGISGSFILLLLGLYDAVIDAISGFDLAILVAFGLGAVTGLALFSTLLNWLLEEHHDWVLAALVGLMAGSLRVLWPWPAGPDGVGDTGLQAPGDDVTLVVVLAVVGFAAVLGVAALGRQVGNRPEVIA